MRVINLFGGPGTGKSTTAADLFALDVILPDTSGQKWVSMKQTGGKYTLLVVWESTCGHCKKVS